MAGGGGDGGGESGGGGFGLWELLTGWVGRVGLVGKVKGGSL